MRNQQMSTVGLGTGSLLFPLLKEDLEAERAQHSSAENTRDNTSQMTSTGCRETTSRSRGLCSDNVSPKSVERSEEIYASDKIAPINTSKVQKHLRKLRAAIYTITKVLTKQLCPTQPKRGLELSTYQR